MPKAEEAGGPSEWAMVLKERLSPLW
jgi:hypothetical protein